MNHRRPMKIVVASLIAFLLQSPVCAAEKIRIGFPDLAAQFVPLPLAQNRASLRRRDFKENSSAWFPQWE
jgi:hypothetical protein